MEHGTNIERRDLLQTRREEAIAFFHVNQAARNAAERVVTLFFAVAAIAGSVGAAAGTFDVVLPLPPLMLLLLSYMFQQYADLTIIGTARRRLEDLVNDQLGGEGLIYETIVAEIRKKPPLIHSLKLFQVLLGILVVAITVMAVIVAITNHDPLVLVVFGAATTLTAASALYSYLHMLGSEKATTIKLNQQGLGHRRAVWISSNLYAEARDNAPADELEQETFERLIRSRLTD